jgi:hypothetical protein
MSRSLLVLFVSTALLVPIAGAQAGPNGPTDTGPKTQSGFHLETAPYIDPVFGDASEYRNKIDRFLTLYDSEQPLRDEFTTSVATVMADVESQRELYQQGKRAGCPASDIALPYSRAYHLGAAYLKDGEEMAQEYDTLRNLDALGETSGLTPDYKYKVKRTQELWDEVLTDYREMHIAFHDELVPEVVWLGCDPAALLAAGDAAGGAEIADASAPDPTMPLPLELQPQGVSAKPKQTAVASASQPASQPIIDPRSVEPVAFTVDNSGCRQDVAVVLDGFSEGNVKAGDGSTFRTTEGPHDVCVLPVSSPLVCGQQGTIHNDYIHDGWTLTLECQPPPHSK